MKKLIKIISLCLILCVALFPSNNDKVSAAEDTVSVERFEVTNDGTKNWIKIEFRVSEDIQDELWISFFDKVYYNDGFNESQLETNIPGVTWETIQFDGSTNISQSGYIGFHLTSLAAGKYYLYLSEYEDIGFAFDPIYYIGTQSEPTLYTTGDLTSPNLKLLDFSTLQNTINQVKPAYDSLEKYTTDSANAFKALYTEAETELTEQTFLKQSEINNLSDKLLNAWKALAEKKVAVVKSDTKSSGINAPVTQDTTNVNQGFTLFLLSGCITLYPLRKKSSYQ
ncbi:MAG: hypothetical protein ACK5LC_17990 [Coprobacillaceae bacterium]